MLSGQLMKLAEHLAQITHIFEWNHIGAVRRCGIWRLVGFDEHCINAKADRGARKNRRKFPLTTR